MADESKIIILAAGGLGLWWLYENGYLAQWFGSSLAPGATALPSTTPTMTTTPTTTTSSTPASVTLLGPATSDVNNSLQAQVSINGQTMTLNVIPSSGTAWNSTGQNITAQLQSQGVNIASLIAQFQAAQTATATTGSTPTTLTASNAATTPYSSALNSQISSSAFSSAVDALIAAGNVPSFAVGSVIAYMLGLGGSCANGAAYFFGVGGAEVGYTCNGSNWNLTTLNGKSMSGLSGRVSLGAVHGGLSWRVNRRMIG
jgi:hypothetical protein